MAYEKTQNQLVFDPLFTEDIKHICTNDLPKGAAPEDFRVVEQPEFGALMFDPDKEALALEVLFTAVGRKWYEAKSRAVDTEDVGKWA